MTMRVFCAGEQHPDQAAGAMVEFALRAGKPFACVPCCVYSKVTHTDMRAGRPFACVPCCVYSKVAHTDMRAGRPFACVPCCV